MPIYEYRCKNCAHKFETLRGMRDDTPAACPACGDDETMRLLSVFAAQTTDGNDAPPREAVPAWGGSCCGGGCGCARN